MNPNCAFQGSRYHNDRSWSRHHRSLPHGLHHQVWFPLLEFLQILPSVELVGKKEQFPGIPWNTTVFSIVGLVIVVVLCVHYLELRNMIAIPFAVGEATNGLVAYIFPNWIHFQVASRF